MVQSLDACSSITHTSSYSGIILRPRHVLLEVWGLLQADETLSGHLPRMLRQCIRVTPWSVTFQAFYRLGNSCQLHPNQETVAFDRWGILFCTFLFFLPGFESPHFKKWTTDFQLRTPPPHRLKSREGPKCCMPLPHFYLLEPLSRRRTKEKKEKTSFRFTPEESRFNDKLRIINDERSGGGTIMR